MSLEIKVSGTYVEVEHVLAFRRRVAPYMVVDEGDGQRYLQGKVAFEDRPDQLYGIRFGGAIVYHLRQGDRAIEGTKLGYDDARFRKVRKWVEVRDVLSRPQSTLAVPDDAVYRILGM